MFVCMPGNSIYWATVGVGEGKVTHFSSLPTSPTTAAAQHTEFDGMFYATHCKIALWGSIKVFLYLAPFPETLVRLLLGFCGLGRLVATACVDVFQVFQKFPTRLELLSAQLPFAHEDGSDT